MVFRETLNAETDRGCALMAGAFLDDQLKAVIGRTLVQNDKVLGKVFEPNGAVGTFSSRIDFAYLLGQIGPKAHRDLHLVRQIRNQFGHTARPLTFEEPSIADRCAELYYDVGAEKLPPRKKFTRVVLGILGVVHAAEARTESRNEADDPEIDESTTKSFLQWKATVTASLEDDEKEP